MKILDRIKLIDEKLFDRLKKCSGNAIFSFVSYLGNFAFIILCILIVVLLPIRNNRDISIVLTVSLMINTLIVFVVKFGVGRKRSKAEMYFFNKLNSYSFPSGHVSRLSGFIFPLINYPLLMLFFFILSFFVGVSRMIKGYHYLSDCVIGFFVGLAGGYLAFITSSFYLDFIKRVIEVLYFQSFLHLYF